MHTKTDEVSGGRRRRIHSDEFKAQLVAACQMPGMSTAAVAMAQGVNPNLVRRWIQEAEGRTGSVPARTVTKPRSAAFVPVQLAASVPASLPNKLPVSSASASPADIRVELRRGPLAISVSWPSDAAAQCSSWLSELLR